MNDERADVDPAHGARAGGGPARPGLQPAVRPGQYCAPSGQCFMPPPRPQAPAASPPPADQPPAQPGYAYPPQGYTPAQAQAYPTPVAAGLPLPAPAPAYQQPAPAYQQPAPAYQQPASYAGPPPAGYPPAQLVAPQRSPYREGPRFGLFLGGLVLPGADVSAAAGGAVLTFGARRIGFESRIYAAFAHVEDDHTKTNAGVAVAHGTYWWGAYGLGFGSGLGYADFTRKDSGAGTTARRWSSSTSRRSCSASGASRPSSSASIRGRCGSSPTTCARTVTSTAGSRSMHPL